MSVATFTELEACAADVIAALKSIGEYSNSRVAVIGGLAVWKHIPEGRTTQVIWTFRESSTLTAS